MKKTGLNGYVYDFSADYGAIGVDGILDIHRLDYMGVYDFRADYDAIRGDDILEIHKYLIKNNKMM